MSYVIGNYTIKKTPLNYTVYENFINDKGKESQRFKGYYGNFKSAVKSLTNYVLEDNEFSDVNTLLNLLNKHEKNIEKLLEELK